MKATKFFTIAAVALLSSAMFSCSKSNTAATALYLPPITEDVAPDSVVPTPVEDLNHKYTWLQLSAADCSYSLFTDDLISSTFRGRAATFPVIIEEALECPGMYRLVNPMSAFALSNEKAAGQSFNLIINATNPDKVLIERQRTGVDLGSGAVSIESLASHFTNKGNPSILIEDAGYYGKLANGEITFPTGASFLLWANGASDKTNLNGTFRIILPEKVAAIENSIDKSDYALGLEYIARMENDNKVPSMELDPAALSTDSYALK